MAQINIHVQPGFAADLETLMTLRGLRTKSEAIRLAVREAVERLTRARSSASDFRSWKGEALKAGAHSAPRFQSDDDLWA